MFLVTSHKESADILIKELSENNISSIRFPLVEISKNYIDLDNVLNIIANDAVFCTSPTAALFAQDILLKLNNSIVVAPGVGTASAINKINSKLDVKFPLLGSGINHIINEGIISDISRLSILGNNNINLELLKFCNIHSIKVTNIALYNYNLFYKNKIRWLNSILEKTCAITGIIVTSGKIADGINYLMQFEMFKKKFKNATFIASHDKIAKKLSFSNLNIIISENPSTEQVINSVKKVVYCGR